MTCVVIGPFRASNVNIFGNDLVAGLPSPSAFLGMAGLIRHRLGYPGWGQTVLPVLHDVDLQAGRLKPEYKVKDRVFKPSEIPEMRLAHVVASAIIRFDQDIPLQSIREMAGYLRIAGGVAFPASGSSFEDCVREGPSSFDGQALQDTLREGPRIQRRGYAMLASGREGDGSILSNGVRETMRPLFERLYPEGGRKTGEGWLIPMPAGYALLETPRSDRRARGSRSQDIPHVFGEPLVGIGELVSIAGSRFRDMTEQDLMRQATAYAHNQAGNAVLFSKVFGN